MTTVTRYYSRYDSRRGRSWLPVAGLVWWALVWGWPAVAGAALQVAVSVPPQAYFVNRIAGDLAEVEVMIPPGHAPATYAPAPRQIQALTKARLYVKVGHPNFVFETAQIEPLLRNRENIEVVDMSSGLEYRTMGLDEGHHDHRQSDPHVWVAPYTVRIAVKNITAALQRLDPAHKAQYAANRDAFLADIDRLDQRIRRLLQSVENREFLVYHPAWGYFAQQYGLTQIPIELGGKEPSPRRVTQVIDLARERGIKVLFVQEGFSQRSARVIAQEIGAVVLPIDPLARDWLTNMQRVAETFREALADEP